MKKRNAVFVAFLMAFLTTSAKSDETVAEKAPAPAGIVHPSQVAIMTVLTGSKSNHGVITKCEITQSHEEYKAKFHDRWKEIVEDAVRSKNWIYTKHVGPQVPDIRVSIRTVKPEKIGGMITDATTDIQISDDNTRFLKFKESVEVYDLIKRSCLLPH